MQAPVAGHAGYDIHDRWGLQLRSAVKINASVASGVDGGPGVERIRDCALNAEETALLNGCFRDTRKNGRFLYGITDHISDHASCLVGKELNRCLATIDAAPGGATASAP